MKFSKFFLCIIFFSKSLYSLEVQYFISPYFYQNPHSYSVNGVQYYKYLPGELLETAIKESNLNYSKCADSNKTDLILYLYPSTYYNPMMTVLYTDLNVRIYMNQSKNNKNIQIHFQNNVLLSQNSDRQFVAHYENLLKKLSVEIQKLKLEKSDIKISGGLCKIFM